MSCGGPCSQSQPQMLRPELTAVHWHPPSPFGWIARLINLQARWRMREELAALSDAQLRDVGLTREEVDATLARPFWRS